VSSFLLQGAADPEHPNKHPDTPHPVRVDLHNFEETEWTKTGRAAACRFQTAVKSKWHFYIRNSSSFPMNADDESVKIFN